MQHVMIDLETLGTKPNASIIAIGAVKFDPNREKWDEDRITDALYLVIDPASCDHFNLKIDGDTVKWWMHPDRAAAREALLAGTALDIASALDGFATWFGPTPLPVWGNGANFDNVIMRSAFTACHMETPWKFYHDRCFRTLKNLGDLIGETPRVGTAHQALDDATWQAHHLQNVVHELGLRVS